MAPLKLSAKEISEQSWASGKSDRTTGSRVEILAVGDDEQLDALDAQIARKERKTNKNRKRKKKRPKIQRENTEDSTIKTIHTITSAALNEDGLIQIVSLEIEPAEWLASSNVDWISAIKLIPLNSEIRPEAAEGNDEGSASQKSTLNMKSTIMVFLSVANNDEVVVACTPLDASLITPCHRAALCLSQATLEAILMLSLPGGLLAVSACVSHQRITLKFYLRDNAFISKPSLLYCVSEQGH